MPALYSHTTRANGTVLTATIYNGDHQNHIDNGVPAQLDDYSVNVGQMQTQTSPGGVGTESLPTSLSGELERLRFVIAQMKGTSFWYDPGTQSNALIGVQVKTATGIYTPTAGTRSVIVELVGGGGGSGGTSATGAGTISATGGGGAGGYTRGRFTSAFSGVTVTIGAGGAAGASGAGVGGNGGASSFGALLACNGGVGSSGRGAFTPPWLAVGGGGGAVTTAGNISDGRGADGGSAISLGTGDSVSGVGAGSAFGAGGTATGATGAGVAATTKGAGGGGAFTGVSAAAQVGGAGAAGLAIIYEYA